MTPLARFRVLSRRGLRVLVFTLHAMAMACSCEDDYDVSACMAELQSNTCVIPAPLREQGVRYIPSYSNCESCSGCQDVRHTFFDTEGGGCVPACKALCAD
jgi:hypothetical protein